MRSLLHLIIIWGCFYSGVCAQQPVPRFYHSNLYNSTGVLSLYQPNPFAANDNAAILAHASAATIGLNVQKLYDVPQLKQVCITTVLPVQQNAFAFTVYHQGIPEFNETQAALKYGMSLSENTGIGAGLLLNTYKGSGMKRAYAYSFELGIIQQLAGGIAAGVQVKNPAGSKYTGTDNEKMESVYRVMLGYEPSEKFYSGMSYVLRNVQPDYLQWNLHYYPVEKISIKAVMQSAPMTMLFGVGYQAGRFYLDVYTTYHTYLGLSPGVQFVYHIKTQSK